MFICIEQNMNELFVNRAKTVAITGHRVIYPDFNREKVKNIFLSLIEKGFDTFLIGMALGFDTECFNILEQIKKEKKIFIIACIPCLTQSYKFNSIQKEEYDRMSKASNPYGDGFACKRIAGVLINEN